MKTPLPWLPRLLAPETSVPIRLPWTWLSKKNRCPSVGGYQVCRACLRAAYRHQEPCIDSVAVVAESLCAGHVGADIVDQDLNRAEYTRRNPIAIVTRDDIPRRGIQATYGAGSPKSVEAYAWYTLARENGDDELADEAIRNIDRLRVYFKFITDTPLSSCEDRAKELRRELSAS